MLDECGTTGPYFGGLDDPAYWVASGAYWAYFWARAATSATARVGVVGQSQFMDSPDREPGVTMMCVRVVRAPLPVCQVVVVVFGTIVFFVFWLLVVLACMFARTVQRFCLQSPFLPTRVRDHFMKGLAHRQRHGQVLGAAPRARGSACGDQRVSTHHRRFCGQTVSVCARISNRRHPQGVTYQQTKR